MADHRQNRSNVVILPDALLRQDDAAIAFGAIS